MFFWPRPFCVAPTTSLSFLLHSASLYKAATAIRFHTGKTAAVQFYRLFFFVAAVAEHSRAPCKGPCCWINKGAHGASCLTAKVKEQVSLSPRRYRQSVAMETDGRAPRVFVPFPERTRSLLTSANSAQLSSFSAFQLGVSPAMALGSSLHSRG